MKAHGRRSFAKATSRLGVAVLMAGALTACSSGGSKSTSSTPAGSGSSGTSANVTSQVNALLIAGRKTAVWKSPGPNVKASSLNGKLVFALVDNQSLPFSQSVLTGLKDSSTALGFKLTTGDGNYETIKDLQLLQSAVNQKVDAIILTVISPATVASALTSAKAAGIPVITMFGGDPGAPDSTATGLGVVGGSTYCYSCAGGFMADYAIANLDAKVNATIIYDSTGTYSLNTVSGFKKQLTTYCPDTCSAKLADTHTGNFAQATTNAAQVAATSPDTNVIAPSIDAQVTYVLPVVNSAGASKRIIIASQNADLAPMQQIATGTAVKINIGAPNAWVGWGAMDQVVRALLKQPAVNDENIPLRIFDDTNIKTIDLTASPDSWYGDVSYQDEYKKLWSLGS